MTWLRSLWSRRRHRATGRATLVTRQSEREWVSRELFDTIAPRLLGFDEPTRFTF